MREASETEQLTGAAEIEYAEAGNTGKLGTHMPMLTAVVTAVVVLVLSTTANKLLHPPCMQRPQAGCISAWCQSSVASVTSIQPINQVIGGR